MHVAQRIFGDLGIITPFVVVAYTIGFLSGVSNQPIIAALIPAIISFVGGLFAVTLFKPVSQSLPIGIGVCAFALTMVYALFIGAQVREQDRFDRIIYLSQQEQKIRLWRENRDLPSDPAEWILQPEKK